ncbi:hypothetical protein [Amycolatopsis sp. NPDC004378]
MIKRALAALLAAAAIVATAAAPAAAATEPTGKPKTDCVWIWTAKGPVCHWQ